MTPRIRTGLAAAVIALAALAGAGLPGASAAGASSNTARESSTTAGASAVGVAAAACAPVTWGSLAKSATGTGTGRLTNVRAGQQDCYDRLVMDGSTFIRAEYVDQVRADGSGAIVPLRGGAKLQIVTSSTVDPWTGTAAYHPVNPNELVNVTGFPTFRQVAAAGDFEGQATIGLGVRARLPFRVLVLTGPPRVVIDVANNW